MRSARGFRWKVPIHRGNIATSTRSGRFEEGTLDRERTILWLRDLNREERKRWMIKDSTWEGSREDLLDRMDTMDEEDLAGLKASLKSLEKEIHRQKGLVQSFLDVHSSSWDALVVQHRTELSDNFFEFLVGLKESVEDQDIREGLVTLYNKLGTLCEIHDRVVQDGQAMASAAQEFANVLDVNSLGEAEAKIDAMAKEGRLSPAFMLTMAKAWSGAKESNMTRDEVKDILAHLYFRTRDNMARQQPSEARILKYILTFEDEAELRTQLTHAFTEAPEFETTTEDYLSTTPTKLLALVDAVLGAYQSQGMSPMIKDAAGLMRPEVISKIEHLRAVIMSDYM